MAIIPIGIINLQINLVSNISQLSNNKITPITNKITEPTLNPSLNINTKAGIIMNIVHQPGKNTSIYHSSNTLPVKITPTANTTNPHKSFE